MRQIRMSASSNGNYLDCQLRYLYSHVYGMEVEKEKESLRVGGRWHKCHEILEAEPEALCPVCSRRPSGEVAGDCYMCNGTGYTPADLMESVTRYLNQEYSRVPDNVDPDEWELERVKLLYSLVGHQWHYTNVEKRFDVIGSETKFELPIYKKPSSKRPLSKVVFVGKIDRLVRDKGTGLVYVWERKSTSRPLNADYWEGLTQGDQITGYIWGGRVAQAKGMLTGYGIGPNDPPIAGAFCDVWHKPTINPKMLSQKDTKTLIETGEYCGEKFDVHGSTEHQHLVINGTPTPIIEGKSGIAIMETAELYGARLLQDIVERPEFYFEQCEVGRTDYELEQFAAKLPKLAQQIRYVEKNNLWVPNLHNCTSPFRCEFCDFCRSGRTYEPGDQAPVGYKLGYGSTPPVPEISEIEIGE